MLPVAVKTISTVRHFDEKFVAKIQLTDSIAMQNAITEIQHQKKDADNDGEGLEMVLRRTGPKRRITIIPSKPDEIP